VSTSEHRFWRSKAGIVCAMFLGIAAFFLITEHSAHIFRALPWLLLAAMPLMHVFMHRHREVRDDTGTESEPQN
jgi:hypothetical protein